MKTLNVALIVKGSASTYERQNRNMGYWSYPVPWFVWEHKFFGVQDIPVKSLRDYDVIVHEDGGNWGNYIADGNCPPVVYHSIDDTLSEAHYQARYKQASRANMILVDHGDLNRFKSTGKPVRRWAYCVNDGIFKPAEKTLDVNFYCGTGARHGAPGGVERTALRQYLDTICKQAGYSYRSGAAGLLEYAEMMGKSRVIVNWPRTPNNRPHRVFDAMASGCALVTGPLPDIREDYRECGTHYRQFATFEELPEILDEMLAGGYWEDYAEAGRKLVLGHHTWKIRSYELREMLAETFGL